MTAPARALCADEAFDPAWWDEDSLDHQIAAQVCRQCPLLPSCRLDAQAHRLSGMYGAVLFDKGRRVRPPKPIPVVGDAHAARAEAVRLWPESPRVASVRRAELLAAAPAWTRRSA